MRKTIEIVNLAELTQYEKLVESAMDLLNQDAIINSIIIDRSIVFLESGQSDVFIISEFEYSWEFRKVKKRSFN